MKKLFLILVCLFAGVLTLSAQKTIYVIDNETVEHFDGSQVKGKFVKDYKITTTGTGRDAITVHAITTAHSSFSFSYSAPQPDSLRMPDTGAMKVWADTIYFPKGISTFQNSSKKIVYVIDGKESDEDDFKSISKRDIVNITVLKNTSPKAKAFGVNAEVIMIQTKKAKNDPKQTLQGLIGIKKEADGSVTLNGKPAKSVTIDGEVYYSIEPIDE
jgi:hypothetical protein